MPRYEYPEGTASKFWEIELAGKSFTCRFGKLGANGQTQRKDFATPAVARAAHDKLVADKTKQGYVLARAAPAPRHARDARLEAAIAADPDDAGAYLVYADWLQSHGDPRGELIVLQHGNKTKQATKLFEQHAAHFLGELAEFTDCLEPYPYSPLGRATTWRWGYLEAAWLSTKKDRDKLYRSKAETKREVAVVEALGWLLDHPSARFLRELTVGIVRYDGNDYTEVIATLAERKLPVLKKLVLGDFYSEETELNWSTIGSVEPLYKAVPNLESLVLRSGSMKLGKIKLPRLRELSVITGGFDKPGVASVCAETWPHLERLSLQLGKDAAWRKGGRDAIKPQHLQAIFDAKAFPKLTHLGLGNSQIADELCASLASSRIAAQLESLDLSLGTLGDDGVAALVAGKFPKLRQLDVSQNFITKRGLAQLKPLAKKLVTDKQRDDGGDPDNRYIAGYE